MFLSHKLVVLNLIILINFIVKTRQDSTKDSRDEEIERLKNELKRMKEKVNKNSKITPDNRYAVAKTYIEKFETRYGVNFEPDMSYINRKSSTSEDKNILIRRQRCEYIFENMADAHQVDHIRTRLRNAGIRDQWEDEAGEFCTQISEAYSIIFQKLESDHGEETSLKNESLFDDPTMEKCVEILMLSFTAFHPKFDGTEGFVRIPKSLYLDWMKKDAEVAVLKNLNNKEMERLNDKADKIQARLEQNY